MQRYTTTRDRHPFKVVPPVLSEGMLYLLTYAPQSGNLGADTSRHDG